MVFSDYLSNSGQGALGTKLSFSKIRVLKLFWNGIHVFSCGFSGKMYQLVCGRSRAVHAGLVARVWSVNGSQVGPWAWRRSAWRRGARWTRGRAPPSRERGGPCGAAWPGGARSSARVAPALRKHCALLGQPHKPVASGNASSAILLSAAAMRHFDGLNSQPAASWGWLTSSAFASIIS